MPSRTYHVPIVLVIAVLSGGCSDSDLAQDESTGFNQPEPQCGNLRMESGEECDGNDYGDQSTCWGKGYRDGVLSCDACQLDASGCEPRSRMVEVPGGVFEMGSTVNPDEMPIRQVQVDVFWIDETEVTVADYSDCVEARGCGQRDLRACDPGASGDQASGDDHPVNCVDWNRAEQYCAWVDGGTKRLPTEAEWEKAARGTDARTYPWGDAPEPSCSHAVMHEGGGFDGWGCGTGSTMPVGGKPLGASPYGALDMAGNVGEWVADWYASYDAMETDNPTGPEPSDTTGHERVIRGGAANNQDPEYLRVSLRGSARGNFTGELTGFRCVRSSGAP